MTSRALEEIPIEQPVNSKETLPAFEKAITKSKLLYEKVMRSANFQFAILYNGNLSQPKDLSLIYTSSIDGKVYSRSIEADEIFSREIGGNLDIKEGFFEFTDRIKTKYYGKEKSKLLGKGILAHNGRVVISNFYLDIEDIGQSFLLANDLSYGEYIFHLYDYTGNIWLDFKGGSIWRNEGLSETLEFEDESIHLILYDNEDEKIDKRKRQTLYMVYKNELYKVIENDYFGKLYTGDGTGDVRVQFNRFVIKAPGRVNKVLREYSPSVLVSHAEKIKEPLSKYKGQILEKWW